MSSEIKILLKQINSIQKTNTIFQIYISFLKNSSCVLKVKPTPLLYLLSELLKLLKHSETVARRYSVKKVFLKITQKLFVMFCYIFYGFAKLISAT